MSHGRALGCSGTWGASSRQAGLQRADMAALPRVSIHHAAGAAAITGPCRLAFNGLMLYRIIIEGIGPDDRPQHGEFFRVVTGQAFDNLLVRHAVTKGKNDAMV